MAKLVLDITILVLAFVAALFFVLTVFYWIKYREVNERLDKILYEINGGYQVVFKKEWDPETSMEYV